MAPHRAVTLSIFALLLAISTLGSLPSGMGAPSPQVLSAPTGLASVAPHSMTQLNLSWTNPGGTLTNDTVYASVTGSCSGMAGHSTSGPVSSFHLTGLAPNTVYCVAVGAWDADGQGHLAWGNFTTLPGPVNGVHPISATTSTVTLAWSNGGGTVAIVNVTLFYHAATCTSWSVLSAGSGLTVDSLTGLASGTKYCVAICAWNSVGMTTLCGWANVSTQGAGPTNLVTSSPFSDQIHLTWVNPSGIVINDTVRFAPTCSAWTVVSAGVISSYTIAGLVATAKYCVSVQAWNNDGSVGVVYANQTTVPLSVGTITVSTVTPTGLTLKWANPGGAITNVSLWYVPLSCFGPVSLRVSLGNVTLTSVTGLGKGLLYCFILANWNAGGGSNTSATSVQTPNQLPLGNPTGLAVVTQDSFSITLSWSNPTGQLSNNTLWYGPNCSATIHPVGTGSAVTSFRLLGLAPVTNYCMKVQAWNNTFNSSLSAGIFGSTGGLNGIPTGCSGGTCTNISVGGQTFQIGPAAVVIGFGLIVAGVIAATVVLIDTDHVPRRKKK